MQFVNLACVGLRASTHPTSLPLMYDLMSGRLTPPDIKRQREKKAEEERQKAEEEKRKAEEEKKRIEEEKQKKAEQERQRAEEETDKGVGSRFQNG